MSDAEKTQISLRAPIELIASYDRLAGILERDRSWVILRALRAYLEGEGKDIFDDAAALKSMHQEEGVDFDEVLDAADARIAESLRRKA